METPLLSEDLRKLALVIDLFDRKTRSHLDLSDTNRTELGAKDSHHNPKVYSVVEKKQRTGLVTHGL